MSSGRRAFDIARAYVNHGWDRLSTVDNEAEAELREALEKPVPQQTPAATPAPTPMTVDIARRLLDVDANASAKQVQKAYDDLAKAVDPARFSADPQASARAKELSSRLRVALELAK
ncbi:hypothetical protein EON82_21225, partial [bacterium]